MCFRPMLLGCFLFASVVGRRDGAATLRSPAQSYARRWIFLRSASLRHALGGGHNVASACCVCGMPDHIKHSPAQFTHSHPFTPIHSHTHTLSASHAHTCCTFHAMPCSATRYSPIPSCPIRRSPEVYSCLRSASLHAPAMHLTIYSCLLSHSVLGVCVGSSSSLAFSFLFFSQVCVAPGCMSNHFATASLPCDPRPPASKSPPTEFSSCTYQDLESLLSWGNLDCGGDPPGPYGYFLLYYCIITTPVFPSLPMACTLVATTA